MDISIALCSIMSFKDLDKFYPIIIKTKNLKINLSLLKVAFILTSK